MNSEFSVMQKLLVALDTSKEACRYDQPMACPRTRRSQDVPQIPGPALPELPVEILMQVLEDAAVLSRQSAFAVSLVCSWARKLALPSLFAALVHRKTSLTVREFSSAVRSPSGLPTSRIALPKHLGRYVRSLWTESIGITSPTSELDIFRSCPFIEQIALPPPALRALYMACKTAPQPGTDEPPFPCRVRQMTIVTHTMRYEWHFLADVRAPDGSIFLHNITHLCMIDMQISSFVPHALLPNLTHIALPYLDLGTNRGDLSRLPEGLLGHPSLKMIVLTVDEKKYLTNPWYHIMRHPLSTVGNVNYTSPRVSFCELVTKARLTDERIYVALSPLAGQNACQEWAAAARGGETIWERAARARDDPNYGVQLPEVYTQPAWR